MPAGDMDAEYSIGVKNRFIGIDSDMIEDPLELIRAAQEKPKKEKEPKGKPSKRDVKPVKGGRDKEKSVKISETLIDTSSDDRKAGSGDRGRGRGRGVRGGRGGDRGGDRGGRGRGRGFSGESPKNENSGGFGDAPREPRPMRGACHACGEEGHFARNCPNNNTDDTPNEYSNNSGGFGAPTGGFGSVEGDDKRGGRGGFRGGRGGKGGKGSGRGGRREFDRRSGSDKSSSVKAFEKRDGSGSYNWGTPKDELAATEEQVGGGFGMPGNVEDTPAETTENVPESEETTSGTEENKENAEPQQISFDEWKSQQQQERYKPQHNIRKANEGEKIKGLKVIKKPTEEENESDGSLFFPKRYIEEKLKTSGRVKEHMNLDFQFTAGDNRHLDLTGGRRARGRSGRTGRGRKDDNSSGGFGGTDIQLENQDEFPTLG